MQLISAFAAAILGLSLHQAAYSAEIIRGGLLSVDQGQLEAAAALGIPPRRRLSRIILPQAMRSIIPNATNEVIGLVKGASVVFVIALPEVFYAVQVIYNRNSRVIPLLLVAVVWYTIITTVLSIAQYYIERHYARGAVRVLPPTPLQRFRHWVGVQWARLGDGDSGPPPLVGVDAAARRERDRSVVPRTTRRTPEDRAHEHRHRDHGPDAATRGLVEIHNVHKSYGGRRGARAASTSP